MTSLWHHNACKIVCVKMLCVHSNYCVTWTRLGCRRSPAIIQISPTHSALVKWVSASRVANQIINVLQTFWERSYDWADAYWWGRAGNEINFGKNLESYPTRKLGADIKMSYVTTLLISRPSKKGITFYADYRILLLGACIVRPALFLFWNGMRF